MAGTHVVTSREKVEFGKGARSRRCSIVTTTWTADASAATVPDLSLVLNGYLVKAITNPTTATEVTSITCVADVAGSLNSTFFTINAALNATAYYVWFNVNAAGVDPAPGGTGIEVALATGATAAAVATAVATALDAQADFIAPAPGAAIVTVTNAAAGFATNATNGAASPGFTFTIVTQGTHPTDNYDLVINDAEGIDAVGSDLLNRDYINTEQVYPAVGSLCPPFLAGAHTIVFTNNSVVSASGRIILYLVDRL